MKWKTDRQSLVNACNLLLQRCQITQTLHEFERSGDVQIQHSYKADLLNLITINPTVDVITEGTVISRMIYQQVNTR